MAGQPSAPSINSITTLYDDSSSDVPPTPPPKSPGRTFGFPTRPSFSSFASTRQDSGGSLLRPRLSESQSTLNGSETIQHSTDDGESNRTLINSSSSITTTTSSETRKSKSSRFGFNVLRRPSKPQLHNDFISSIEIEPPLPIIHGNRFQASSTTSLQLQSGAKKGGRSRRLFFGPKKKDSNEQDNKEENKVGEGRLYELDDDFEKMDDIVDFSKVPSGSSPVVVGSPSLYPSGYYEAPQSWAVAPKFGEQEPDLCTSADESDTGMNGNNVPRHESSESDRPGPSNLQHVPPAVASLSTSQSTQSFEKRRKSKSAKSSGPAELKWTFRVYLGDNEYHMVSIPLRRTVEELIPTLNRRVFKDVSNGHRLYLKERGGERLLSLHERPANILRRRLEQAGYDGVDCLEKLGMYRSLSFLLKFVYKSTLSTFRESSLDDIRFGISTNIDLTGRGLRLIPVSLYVYASSIVTLKLSRNPIFEIPLDFIQECISLCELKLSHMAMKKVPPSIQHSPNLNKLDLSSNRIGDLDEAFLDGISSLNVLLLHNNKIERLPWYFARMHSLSRLCISNNKIREFPMVVTKIESLLELDISFNLISELPEEIVEMQKLKILTMVGNQVTQFPQEFAQLVSLEALHCQWNHITSLNVVHRLPNLEYLNAEHNALSTLELPMSFKLIAAKVSHNDIQQVSMISEPAPSVIENPSYGLTGLDLSYTKLSSLDKQTLMQLPLLQTLILDHNTFRNVPEAIGELKYLEKFSCSDNLLELLPSTIGSLQNLVSLDLHNNQLCELPWTLWNCGELTDLNLTSNALENWMVPPPVASPEELQGEGRKMSIDSMNGHVLPPLALSLRKLYLGENHLTNNAVRPLRVFKELLILNLSFNCIEDLPHTFLRHMLKLQELYLSGNKLTSIPTEDLFRLVHLKTLFLNGNKLQTLPKEIGDLQSLTKLDVGSNLLKYNINNEEFDWHWKSNPKLRYLNLSGNNRFSIKSKADHSSAHRSSRDLVRSGFSDLADLRVLGLVDVTITKVDIPDETDTRRVRTSHYDSTINGMAYGIADLLGKSDYLTMLDLVHKFPGREGEAIFAMFGSLHSPEKLTPGLSPNKMAKFLQQNFVRCFLECLEKVDIQNGESIPDAMRRTFLDLNQALHDAVFANPRKMSQVSASSRKEIESVIDSAIMTSGSEAVVIYFKGKTLYAANVGGALAVVSRQGVANNLSKRHDPHEWAETVRIRNAEGWISPAGFVNDEVGVSRSFGYFHLLPIINARPEVCAWDLTEEDEFVIVANCGLWDYVSYQTAVDIVRSVPRPWDPMIAAQKLRDLAVSYGADGCTMIMVIRVADLFGTQPVEDQDDNVGRGRLKPPQGIATSTAGEVPAPVGNIALVFTDIRNSTHLWEVNPGMPVAIRIHNNLLRRQLRVCGGYEVKTEGDAFMCSFPNVISAVWWCVSVQTKLLNEPWPLEILECEDGKAIYDSDDILIARGLSVRMGIHCGSPICEPDPVTQRMDYFGPMVNRSARINGSAAGGQIMISADIEREIREKITQNESALDLPPHLQEVVENIREIRIAVIPVGEVKLKGLELPEILSALYPSDLASRHDLKEDPSELTASGSRVQFSVPQMWELGLLCLRIEALASGRIFRPTRKNSLSPVIKETCDTSGLYIESDPLLVLPPINDKSTDSDLMFVLDSLSVRIQNALGTIVSRSSTASPTVDKRVLLDALNSGGGIDKATLDIISSIVNNL